MNKSIVFDDTTKLILVWTSAIYILISNIVIEQLKSYLFFKLYYLGYILITFFFNKYEKWSVLFSFYLVEIFLYKMIL